MRRRWWSSPILIVPTCVLVATAVGSTLHSSIVSDQLAQLHAAYDRTRAEREEGQTLFSQDIARANGLLDVARDHSLMSGDIADHVADLERVVATAPPATEITEPADDRDELSQATTGLTEDIERTHTAHEDLSKAVDRVEADLEAELERRRAAVTSDARKALQLVETLPHETPASGGAGQSGSVTDGAASAQPAVSSAQTRLVTALDALEKETASLEELAVKIDEVSAATEALKAAVTDSVIAGSELSGSGESDGDAPDTGTQSEAPTEAPEHTTTESAPTPAPLSVVGGSDQVQSGQGR